MEILIDEGKLAAVNRNSEEEHPMNNLSRETNVSRVNEDCISQISEEIKFLKVTKKLFFEFRRTESRILGALSKLSEIL